jgi:hypothetical protein
MVAPLLMGLAYKSLVLKVSSVRNVQPLLYPRASSTWGIKVKNIWKQKFNPSSFVVDEILPIG